MNNNESTMGKLFMSKKEVWSFGLGGVGQNMIYGVMSFYLMIFYTDSMGVSAGVTGTMLVIARVWDAFNDPFMGTLVDRFNFKSGKFKPFLMSAPVLVFVLTILIFIRPPFEMTGRIIYMYITYFLWGMAYTVMDVPFWGLAAATTPNEKERADFISKARIFCTVGAMLPMIMMMGFEAVLGISTLTYTLLAVTIAVVGIALFYLAPINVKERIINPNKTTKFSDNFKMLKMNKPLLLVLIGGIVGALRMLAQSAAVYVARYNFIDGIDLLGMHINLEATIVIVLGAGFGVGMMIGTIFAPALVKKYNFKVLYIASALIGFVSQVIFYFVGYNNIFVVMLFLLVAGLSLGIYNVLTYGMIADSVDYLEWKSGKRSEGLCFSFQTFMTKLGAGMSIGVTAIVLSVIGFEGPIEIAEGLVGEFTPQAQSDSVLRGIFALISLVPGIACLLSVIPIFFYDFVGEKQQTILAELRQNRQDQEDARAEEN